MKTLLVRERIWPWPRVGLAVLALTFLSSLACASEYCTKEQYERDRAFIESAINAGILVKGPNAILIHEGFWFDMNYPQLIAFMQRFECAAAGLSGKHLLYMDVRSLGTGKLLATWTLGTLKPAEEPREPTHPGSSEVNEDENRIGLAGAGRAAFINSVTEECNRLSAAVKCSCYANAMADTLSIRELKEASALGNRDVAATALRPKIEAAAKRCQTN